MKAIKVDFISGKVIGVFPEYKLIKIKVINRRKTNIADYKDEEYFETHESSKIRNYLGDYLIGRKICIRVKKRDSFGKILGTYQTYKTK